MRAAFVVQRYGLEVCGGAELHCRQVAELMARDWEVEVFSTCAVDYLTWANHYPAGEDMVNGLRVHRYPVTRCRDPEEFAAVSARVLTQQVKQEEELRWIQLQGPWAPALFTGLEAAESRFDCFIFFTYLYCTTFHGLPPVKHKAFLVPTAHDEPPLRLSVYRDLFHAPRAFIFNTPEESDLIHRRFGNQHIPFDVVGVGVAPPGPPDPQRFRAKHRVNGPFMAYVGRIDVSKGCDLLVSDFRKLQERCGENLSLVLMGQAHIPLPSDPSIRPLGFVSEMDKFDALAAAHLLVVPSQYESLSMAILEAWSVGTPVLVNGKCDVLVGQCRRAQGGLWYTSPGEFVEATSYLLGNTSLRRRLGENGYRYVQANYSWDRIRGKYLRFVPRVLAVPAGRG